VTASRGQKNAVRTSSRTAWFLAACIGAAIIPQSCRAEPGYDQIALVIPAVQHKEMDLDDETATWMSYIVGQSIKLYSRHLSGMHRSAVVIIPARLGTTDPSTIARLARINGAQIALVLTAFRQASGILVDAVMAVPDRYHDLRTDPLEVLDLTFDGARISLDIPSRYVSFTNLFLSDDVMKGYTAGPYRELCPLDKQCKQPRGECRLLGRDIPLSEVVRYLEIGTTAKLIYNGVCYAQKWPATRAVSGPVIDFIAGVQRYFAGDWERSMERMAAVVESEQSSVDMVLQAYLYLARGSVRLKNPDDAFKYVRLASLIGEQDPKFLETKLFLNFWLLIRSIESSSPERKTLLSRLENDVMSESPFVRRRYQDMLNRLKLHIARTDN
jgi:hypothetical protein